MRRRQVLQGVTAATTLSFAGCSSMLGETGIVLGTVHVANFAYYPQRIQVIVKRDGETLVQRTLSLSRPSEAGVVDSMTIEPSWSQTQTKYTVRARHVTEAGDPASEIYKQTFTQAAFKQINGSPNCLPVEIEVGDGVKAQNPPIEIGPEPTPSETPCGDT